MLAFAYAFPLSVLHHPILNGVTITIAKQVCYDWSRGAENHNPAAAKTSIYLHSPQVSSVYSFHDIEIHPCNVYLIIFGSQLPFFE